MMEKPINTNKLNQEINVGNFDKYLYLLLPHCLVLGFIY